MLHIFDGRVGLDVEIDCVVHAVRVEQIGNFLRYAKFHQIRVGRDKRFFEAFASDDSRNFLNHPFAVIGNGIGNKTIYHFLFLLFLM